MSDMNGMIKGVFGWMCAASLLLTSAAWADVAPPDVCQTENAVCHNAGDTYDKDGVCIKTTCSRGGPQGTTTYDCLKCQAAPASGSAGAPAAPTSGTAGSPTAPASGTPKKDGCSVGVLGSEKGIAAFMLGLGLVALGISRRRR